MKNLGFRKNSLIINGAGVVVPLGWNALGFDDLLDSPLPLSNDVVRALGFVESMAGDGTYYIECTGITGLLWIGYKNGRVTIEINSDEVELPHIKYAHQIQNLYLELSGKELEYNTWNGVTIMLGGKKITGIKKINYVPKKD